MKTVYEILEFMAVGKQQTFGVPSNWNNLTKTKDQGVEPFEFKGK